MITWLQYWLVMPMPTLIISAMAAMPTNNFGGRLMGGGPVREYLLNTFALPALPLEAGARLVEWFATASAFQEWLLALAVAININALLLPLLYLMGELVIGLSAWVSKKNIDLKRQAMR